MTLNDLLYPINYSWLNVKTEKATAPHSSTLAWKIPWMEEPDGLPSMGSHRVGHDWSDLAAAVANMKNKNVKYRAIVKHWKWILLNIYYFSTFEIVFLFTSKMKKASILISWSTNICISSFQFLSHVRLFAVNKAYSNEIKLASKILQRYIDFKWFLVHCSNPNFCVLLLSYFFIQI